VFLCPPCAHAATNGRTVTVYRHLPHLIDLAPYGATMTTLPALVDERTQLRVRALYAATTTDPARLFQPMLPTEPPAPWAADLDDVALLHLLISANLDAIRDDVAGMRDDLERNRADARHDATELAEETTVYLEAALTPDLDAGGVNLYALWTLASNAAAPLPEFEHAVALAAAAWRGLAHRQALAAGGAR
jgi:hypothetical protein